MGEAHVNVLDGPSQPDIVPIQLDNQNDFDQMPPEPQLAFEIKDTDLNRTVSEYQGIEKYSCTLC